jgi:hypothetical protein
MTRTRKPLPDLEGYEPIWGEVRDKLYRFTLAAFKEVQTHYQSIPGDGTRITELWRPLGAVLKVLGVQGAEAQAIKEFFTAQAQETRHEPTGWELALLEALRTRAESENTEFEMTSVEIVEVMGLETEEKPGPKWVGDTLSQYHLYFDKGRPKKKGKKTTAYKFKPERVIDLCGIYLRDTPPDDLSHLSPSENTNDDNKMKGTGENQGTCPYPSPCDLAESMGHEGTCPLEITCPFYWSEFTGENGRGHEGHEKPGDVPEKNIAFFSGEEVEV